MKTLLCTINWIVTDVFKNNTYPYWATICLFTGCQVLTFLLLFDTIYYHLLHNRDIIVNDDRILGTVSISVLFVFNLFFYRERIVNFLKDFNDSNNKKIKKSFSIAYIIIIVILTICNSYLIRNNIRF